MTIEIQSSAPLWFNIQGTNDITTAINYGGFLGENVSNAMIAKFFDAAGDQCDLHKWSSSVWFNVGDTIEGGFEHFQPVIHPFTEKSIADSTGPNTTVARVTLRTRPQLDEQQAVTFLLHRVNGHRAADANMGGVVSCALGTLQGIHDLGLQFGESLAAIEGNYKARTFIPTEHGIAPAPAGSPNTRELQGFETRRINGGFTARFG